MKKISALICLILAVCATSAFALFDVQYYGVRALGMGQAFTAVANDAAAPIYNVAGTGLLNQIEVTGMSSRLFAGEEGLNFSASFVGAVVPLSRDKSYGTVSAGWGYLDDVGLHSESLAYLGYSRHLNDLFQTDLFDVSLGVNFKYLNQKYNRHDLDENLTGFASKDAFAIDAGVLARFANGISVGYSGKYLNSPNMAFFGDTYVGDDPDNKNIQRHHVIGLSYFSELLPLLKIPNFTIAADVEIRKMDTVWMFGAESKIKILNSSFLAIRAGGWQQQLTFGAGYAIPFGGEGEDKSFLTIDYAFILPLQIQNTIGSHFFGLSYRFR